MATLKSAVKKANRTAVLNSGATRTENGMVTNATSGTALVDLFFKAGASRGKDISGIFKLAYEENPLLTLRLAAWMRDIRGGAGERQQFRSFMLNLENFGEIEHAKILANWAPFFGRWDDILIFSTTEMQNHAYELVKRGLKHTKTSGLCAKWMPRKGPIAFDLARYFGLTPKKWRKLVVGLTNVVETQMCAQEWAEINYSHVPSVAAARYQKAFLKHDETGYRAYRDALVKGTDPKVKINASTVYPYDVVKTIRHGNSVTQDVAQKQWEAMPAFYNAKEARILPVIDVSGSMGSQCGGTTTCLDVALSLGLFISERNDGPFKDMFVTFSGRPDFQILKGTLKQRLAQMESSAWEMNTDLMAVFKKLLELAHAEKLSEKEMPNFILICSDMEFDACTSRGRDAAAMTAIKQKYEKAGYKLPNIVFWNIQSRGTGNVPVKLHETGAALVSGFSPSILTSVLSAKSVTPYDIMLETINSERYAQIKIGKTAPALEGIAKKVAKVVKKVKAKTKVKAKVKTRKKVA